MQQQSEVLKAWGMHLVPKYKSLAMDLQRSVLTGTIDDWAHLGGSCHCIDPQYARRLSKCSFLPALHPVSIEFVSSFLNVCSLQTRIPML